MPPHLRRILIEGDRHSALAPILLENALSLAIPPREDGPTACWDKGVLEPLAAEFQPMLGMCLCSANLREDLLGLLHAQEEETRAARSRDTPAIVIEACLVVSHEPAKARVYVGEITAIAKEILKMRGEQPSLSARGVGSIRTQIGSSAERLDQAGYGLRLNQKTRCPSQGLRSEVHKPGVCGLPAL